MRLRDAGRCLANFGRDERGQDIIEYALLAAFVSLVAITGASFLGSALNTWYQSTSGSVDNASSVAGGS